MHQNPATLAVLAGGAGSRMGRPKGFLRIGKKPILEYLLDRWNWSGPTMLVLAPDAEVPPAADRFDIISRDAIRGTGPLQGIFTALTSAKTETIVAATCDMPTIERKHLDWIAQQLGGNLGVMSRRADGDIEPFPSAFRTSALEIIQQRLAAGSRSMQKLTAEPNFPAIPIPADWPEQIWTNLNRPDDLQKFEAANELPRG